MAKVHRFAGVEAIAGHTVRERDAVVGVISYRLADGFIVSIALEGDEAIHSNAKVADTLASNAMEGAETLRDLGIICDE